MNITLIGAGGFLGKRLASRLKNLGHEVSEISTSGVNEDALLDGLASGRFSIRPGTGAVVYLAQSPFYHQVPEMFPHVVKVNVTAAVTAAELARKAGIGRFLYASTGNVYAHTFEPMSETLPLRRDGWYVLSKIHAEEALALYRAYMDVTIVRPFGLYGPGQRGMLVSNLAEAVMGGKEIYMERNIRDRSDANGLKISMCYIDDAVEMFAGLIPLKGIDIINVAGERAVAIREIAEAVGARLGKRPRLTLLDRERRYDLVADVTRLKTHVNPRFTPFDEGIAETVKAMRP